MRRQGNHSTLTSKGVAEIERIFALYDSTSDGIDRIITRELGTERIFGSSHVFDVPREQDGETYVEGPENREYILKVCFSHSESGYREHVCDNHMESWTWEEAKRRDDEDMFAAVVASADDYRWIVMEKGYKWNKPEPGEMPNRTQKMGVELRQEGWKPVDIEVHRIGNQTVVTDYELVFPLDLYEAVYHQSFQQPRLGEWKQFSDRTYDAMRKQDSP